MLADLVKAEVKNVVATVDLRRKIKLTKAANIMLGEVQVRYIPEQFPGLIYRMQEPKVVLLLFQSGKLVCTGARKEEHVYQSIQKINAILTEIDGFEVARR